ncbi:MAG: ATPase domain-containing protein, partial [Candidatus Baldrarchaeia archaeon]
SLEALKSSLRIPEDDISVEQDILRIADKFDANVIFVSETSGESKLDYLVDGVVRLEKEALNERLLRKMYIEKIRGTKIENPMYLFTLKEGRFVCFEKGIQRNFVHAELPKPRRMKRRKIPTLITELDKILGGGFRRGTFNIFDVGEGVGVGHTYVLTPLFFNFILQGYPVFSIPSKGIFSYDIVGEFPPSVLNGEVIKLIEKYFCVFSPPTTDFDSSNKAYKTYFIEGKDFTEDLRMFRDVAVKVLHEVQADTLVVTMASDTMEYIYGTKDLLKVVQAWMDQIKQLNGIVALFQFRHKVLRIPTHLASSYFRLENIGGNVVFYGEIPRTKIYVTALDISDKYVRTRFIPVE